MTTLTLNYTMKELIRRHNGRYYVKGRVGYFRTFEEAYQKAKDIPHLKSTAVDIR